MAIAMVLCSSASRARATLDDLPTELLVKIILELDWRSVLRLQLVNSAFNEIVTTHLAVQYHIELGISGMVDGPPIPYAPFSTDERLRRLRVYQSRWKHFDFKRAQTVRKVTGSVWELASGVLAQGVSTSVAEHIGRTAVRKLLFTRLPSSARVESRTREWTHEYPDFAIRDFTMDPTQDLLVLLRESSGSGGTHAHGGSIHGGGGGGDDMNQAEIHLRSLRTSEKHADAKHGVLVHGLHGGTTRATSHSLQICQDRLAILHKARAGHWPEKLVVYDWKKGKLLFEISFCGIMSYAFLTPQHLLFAVQPFNVMPACHGDHQPRLIICNIDYTAALSPSGHPESYAAICEFHLPELKQYADVVDILIRTDPVPSSSPTSCSSSYSSGAGKGSCYEPSGGLLPPPPAFSTAPSNRLFVISMQVETVPDDMGDHRASESLTLGLFVPLSTFLPFLFSVTEPEIIRANSDSEESLYFGDFTARPLRRIAVQAQDWLMKKDNDGEGRGGARALLVPGAENVWVCNVFGMRVAYALEPRDAVAPLAPRHVAVLDFNADALRRDQARQRKQQMQERHDSSGNPKDSAPQDSEDLETLENESKALVEDYLEPGTLEVGRCGIFEEDVTTSLPYRRTVLREKVRFHGVMLTEDNIIFVNQRAPREYEVLTL
ncbi:hypothetical protein ACEPAI_2639 [Sanghuangporus weigelae]